MKSILLFFVLALAFTIAAGHLPTGGSDSAGSCSCSTAPTSALVSGAVDDCCCSVEVVDDVNNQLRPILSELVKTTYFRHYKLNLWRKCKIFPEDGQCMFRTCAVEECEEAEWKQIWEDEETKEEPEFSRVNSFIEQDAMHTWTEDGDPWTNDMSTAEHEFHYIDLHRNPERFTGYSGPTATRIWTAIYGENCFTSGDTDPTSSDICIEKRAFFRLISGLHTSITVHLAYDYLLDADKGIWGPNPDLFWARAGQFPQRLKNMYFTYLFLLRATQKIAPLLLERDYHTPTSGEASKVHSLIENMTKTVTLTCPATFDETVMFKGPDSDALKRQFKARFRNISEVLDCVTCEKCRLWGKLQINGLGTALKILFELSESDLERAGPRMALQRTEIVALINTLNRLSESVRWSHEMHLMRLKKLEDTAVEKAKQAAADPARNAQKILDNTSSLPVAAKVDTAKSPNYFLAFGLLTPVFTLLLWALSVLRPRSP